VIKTRYCWECHIKTRYCGECHICWNPSLQEVIWAVEGAWLPPNLRGNWYRLNGLHSVSALYSSLEMCMGFSGHLNWLLFARNVYGFMGEHFLSLNASLDVRYNFWFFSSIKCCKMPFPQRNIRGKNCLLCRSTCIKSHSIELSMETTKQLLALFWVNT